jgi:hypothetical protein
VEVSFPGLNWVYLGIADGAADGLAYQTRAEADGSMKFSFQAEKPGDYTLKFFRQDFINDSISNEYVKVAVGEKKAASEELATNDTNGTNEKQEELTTKDTKNTKEEQEGTVTPEEAASAPAAASADPLADARKALADKKYAEALGLLDALAKTNPTPSDEALWIYGQCYEAAGAQRNIRAAMDAYRKLTDEYPQSDRAIDARNRLAWLERFYVDVR